MRVQRAVRWTWSVALFGFGCRSAPVAGTQPTATQPAIHAAVPAASAEATPSSLDGGETAAHENPFGALPPRGDGGPLGSTPESDTPPLADDVAVRGRHLLDAIAQESPALAGDLLLPRDAFALARDTKDPTASWERFVWVPFKKKVTALRKRNGEWVRAQIVAFELGPSVTRLPPKKREWKQPMWRARHSRFLVSVDGKSQRIDVAEMMSWNGVWYISRL